MNFKDIIIKKDYFLIASLLFLGLISCSNEETKTQNQIAARPTVPLQNGEVQIGTQIWMTKNLNVSRYRNGDPIPHVTIRSQWQYLTTGAWCNLHGNQAIGSIFGKLYNGNAVNDPRGLAPVGYHIPSRGEWEVLINFLGGASVAGGKMKATTLWNYPNVGATNSSGFTALPAGILTLGSIFDNGYVFSTTYYGTYFYGSVPVGAGTNSSCYMTATSAYASVQFTDNTNGLSVRCIKD